MDLIQYVEDVVSEMHVRDPKITALLDSFFGFEHREYKFRIDVFQDIIDDLVILDARSLEDEVDLVELNNLIKKLGEALKTRCPCDITVTEGDHDFKFRQEYDFRKYLLNFFRVPNLITAKMLDLVSHKVTVKHLTLLQGEHHENHL